MRCELIRSGDSDWDWWTIERKEHDGREWLQETGPNSASYMRSARPSDACIEGTSDEMLAIAKAITAGESVNFKRCAAVRVGKTYHLSSPRNSQVPAVLTLPESYDLSSDIRLKLDFKAEEPKQLPESTEDKS